MEGSNVDHVVVFRDDTETSEAWSWHAVARNGEIVSQGESHTREEDAARAARGVFGTGIVIQRSGRGTVSE